MITVITCMMVGIGLGLALRKRKLRWLERATTALVWLLLFALGAGIGSRDELFAAIGTIGAQAAVVGIAATLGSCVAAWALWKHTHKP